MDVGRDQDPTYDDAHLQRANILSFMPQTFFYETTKYHQGNYGILWVPSGPYSSTSLLPSSPPSLEDTALINSMWYFVGHVFIFLLHFRFP